MATAKATVIPPPPPVAEKVEKITLELLPKEAEALTMLLGAAASKPYAPRDSENEHLINVYYALTQCHPSLYGLWHYTLATSAGSAVGYVLSRRK